MPESVLIESWRRYLAVGTPGLHLADSSHPLHIFIGTTDAGSPRMVIRTAVKPTKPNLSNLVLVERYEDASGKWNLDFVLHDKKFSEVFLRLADDIHARSRNALSEPTALDRVSVVIDEWRRLLRPRAAGLLSMDELRGLIGELWLVENRFSVSRPIGTAVAGWLGPMGLPQDFWYAEDGYHEAKAVGPATAHVRIASEHQLDVDELQLLILQVATVTEQTPGAVNLPTIVLRIRSALAEDGASTDDLDSRLDRLGIDLAEPFYQDTWFLVSRVNDYRVDVAFPRIAASTLPGGIGRVSYQLELADLEPFKISEQVVS